MVTLRARLALCRGSECRGWYMTRARLGQLIATAMALAGLAGACTLAAPSVYGCHCSSAAQQFAREVADYDHCVMGIRKSSEHREFADLEIDAKCPVKPSESVTRAFVEGRKALRDSNLRVSGAILAFCALPWAAIGVGRIKQRRRHDQRS